MSDGRAPYVRGSDTSEQAAQELTRMSEKERAVWDFVAARGIRGATDEEIQVGLPMDPSTERPRRIALTEREAIVASGQKRLTRANRWAQVWRIGPVGPEASP